MVRGGGRGPVRAGVPGDDALLPALDRLEELLRGGEERVEHGVAALGQQLLPQDVEVAVGCASEALQMLELVHGGEVRRGVVARGALEGKVVTETTVPASFASAVERGRVWRRRGWRAEPAACAREISE